ncbi:MAG: substrate-binding domain-containing protein [Bacteroidetes bacterium]|nr:substrate-binding domain-containing protein [Bacteroidota bacterium]
MGKVRIKDIAEIANVSIGTVDRVIHNRGEVSSATMEKIQKLLDEYDYKPDIIASSLALKRQVRLAVVMPGPVSGHAFWEQPVKGVDRAVEELSSYDISVDTYHFDQFDRNDFVKCMKNFPISEIHGVLFAPVFHEDSVSFVSRCASENVPVVLFNSLLEDAPYSSFVGQDAYHSGYVAAKLINFGLEHRRDVAIINMSARTDHYAHIINREKGFRNYFELHSDRLDNLVTIDLNGVKESRLKQKLDETFQKQKIGGLFVTNSRVYKVAEYLAGRGSMGVRLVGYDLLPESVDYLKRDYIDFLISQKPEEQAFRGLSSLFNLVAFHREQKRDQFMPIDIITRENLHFYQ